jgi:hypothetical protein
MHLISFARSFRRSVTKETQLIGSILDGDDELKTLHAPGLLALGQNSVLGAGLVRSTSAPPQLIIRNDVTPVYCLTRLRALVQLHCIFVPLLLGASDLTAAAAVQWLRGFLVRARSLRRRFARSASRGSMSSHVCGAPLLSSAALAAASSSDQPVGPDDPRLSPEYYAYYYQQRPLDPRLPPPLFNYNNWQYAQSKARSELPNLNCRAVALSHRSSSPPFSGRPRSIQLWRGWCRYERRDRNGRLSGTERQRCRREGLQPSP